MPLLVWGAIPAGCGPAELRPVDPLEPRIRPELAGCTWTESGDQYDHADGSSRPAFTRVEAWDREGRLTERTWDTATTLADGSKWSSASVERWTWRGGCPVDAWYESVHRYADGAQTHVALWSSTTCDRHDNPTEITSASRTDPTGTDGATEAESVRWFDNAYDCGRLVERATVDDRGEPSGMVERLQWDGRRLVAHWRIEPLTPEGAALMGEGGADGVLTETSTFAWDGDRLVVESIDVEQPEPLLYVRTYRYDEDGRWLGDDTTVGPDREHQLPFYTLRFEYAEDEPFPIRERLSAFGSVVYEDRIEVVCD